MHSIEARIIPLLQGKHSQGIDLLYDHYADALYGVAKMIVKDDSLAKDVLQESFVKIWQNGPKYDPAKARLFTWLLTITRRTAIDKLRSTQNRSSKEIQTQTHNVNTVDNGSLNIDSIDVNDHLTSLDGKYQLVLQALFFKGMTQQETSDALNIPLGTVKTRLRNGLKALRKIFGDSEITIILVILMMS